MEKWVKALHAQAPGDLGVGVKQVWNTVIKMVLVMLPVDSCIKSAVRRWTAWWSSLPGGLTVGGKLVFCLIIVVILIGLGRVYRLGRRLAFEVMKWEKATKGWDYLYGGSWPLKTPCRDFNLVIVRELDSMKWLKNGTGHCLHFMQLFLHYIPFGENSISYVKYLYIQHAWISIMKKQNSNLNGKVEKMVVLVKTFDHYYRKLKSFI